MFALARRWVWSGALAESILPSQTIVPPSCKPINRVGGFQSPRLSKRCRDWSDPLCPVRALRAYVNTTSLRKTDNLFVCYWGCRKRAAPSKQRLSHWIVDAFLNAYRAQGLPVPLAVKCHSTRSMTTSWAALKGVPFQDICSVATWSSSCTFARFYRVNVAAPHPVATAVLLTV